MKIIVTSLYVEDQDRAVEFYTRKLGFVVKHDVPAMFGVGDTHAEYRRLSELGVKFTLEPTKAGEHTIAIFDDTCGNLIQIIEPPLLHA